MTSVFCILVCIVFLVKHNQDGYHGTTTTGRARASHHQAVYLDKWCTTTCLSQTLKNNKDKDKKQVVAVPNEEPEVVGFKLGLLQFS